MPTISDLKSAPADQTIPFKILCVLRKQVKRTSRTGSAFTVLELGDRTGTFQVVCFQDSPITVELEGIADGVILRVEGETAHYQGRFSPKLRSFTVVDEADLGDGLTQLVEVSPEDPDRLWEEFEHHVALINNSALRDTVHAAIAEVGDRFRESPAAISMHHAYRFGLLEHTVRMLRAANALLPLYPEVDADLARTGVALHDIGKTLEYSSGLAIRKTRLGVLQGHVVLGYRIVRRAALRSHLDASLLERLEHIVLSHQGLLEWGAAAMAATPEAVFVSMVDNLDAKMGMVQHTLRNCASSDEFSDYHPGLAAPLLVRASVDPLVEQPDEIQPDDCSSPGPTQC